MISTAHSPRLAARFGQNTFVIRSETPLAEDQMRRAAPSIFAEGKHGDRRKLHVFRLLDPWPTARGFQLFGLFSGNALQQEAGGFVLRVLLHQLATEGFGQRLWSQTL